MSSYTNRPMQGEPDRSERTGLAQAPFEPIKSRCVGLTNISAEIKNISEAINDKLFGSKDCEVSKSLEPVSIEDTLRYIENILSSARKILQEINERI